MRPVVALSANDEKGAITCTHCDAAAVRRPRGVVNLHVGTGSEPLCLKKGVNCYEKVRAYTIRVLESKHIGAAVDFTDANEAVPVARGNQLPVR